MLQQFDSHHHIARHIGVTVFHINHKLIWVLLLMVAFFPSVLKVLVIQFVNNGGDHVKLSLTKYFFKINISLTKFFFKTKISFEHHKMSLSHQMKFLS